jgi:hypothetical protein
LNNRFASTIPIAAFCALLSSLLLSSTHDTSSEIPTTDLHEFIEDIDDSRNGYISVLDAEYILGLEPLWKIELTDSPYFITNIGSDRFLVILDERLWSNTNAEGHTGYEFENFILVIDTDGNLLNAINIGEHSLVDVMVSDNGALATVITAYDHQILNIVIDDCGQELLRLEGDTRLFPSPEGDHLISQKLPHHRGDQYFLLGDPFGKKEIILERMINIDGSVYGSTDAQELSDDSYYVLCVLEEQLLLSGKNDETGSWRSVLIDLATSSILWEKEVSPLSSVQAVINSTDDTDQYILFRHPANPENIGLEVVSRNTGELVSRILNWDIYDTRGSMNGLYYSIAKVRHHDNFEYFVIRHNEKSKILSYAMRLEGRTKNKLQVIGDCVWQSYKDCHVVGNRYQQMTALYMMDSYDIDNQDSPCKANAIAIEGTWTVTAVDGTTITIIGQPNRESGYICKYIIDVE